MSIKIIRSILILTLFPLLIWGQSGENNPRPRVGLVLSGGGAKGFAYIGLLKALQEAQLEVDYIGGTSIGSIMGGLYALGYSPEAIEEMIRAQDWEALLADDIDRKYISFEEKEFTEKAIVTIPFKTKNFSLSPSIRRGQEIDLLLNRYFSPAYKSEDFNELHTPFLCMGTNLITGEPVMLTKGNLARAIRASMSIPGFFPPVEYEGKLIIDGGVVNNFPVKNVKEMGAEYIIGGDVQPGLQDDPGKLKSITSILEQMVTFGREEANREAYALTNLYIPLDNPYGILDFAKYDSLIAFGDRVARDNYDRIKALADSLNTLEHKPMKPYNTQPMDSVELKDIYFQGFKRLPLKYFIGNWKDISGQKVAISDIEDKIRRMYGTRFFDHVFYEFQPAGDRINMTVHVVEADPGEVSAAIHYDNNYQASILINASLRNVLGKRSKLLADLVLGPNPRLRALYLIDNGRRVGLGTRLDFYSFKFDLFDMSTKINEIDFTNFKFSVFAHSIVNNRSRFRAGVEYEYFRFRQEFQTDPLLESFYEFTGYTTLFASFNADTRDSRTFPSEGYLAESRLEYIIPVNQDIDNQLFDNSLVIYLNYEQNIPVNERWVIRPGLFAGGTFPGDANVPIQHTFAFGGLNPRNYINTFVPFAGVKFFQRMGNYALVMRTQVQYKFAKKLYATLRADVGSNAVEFSDLFDSAAWIGGYGISAGYDSFIGPIGLTLMGSNINSDPLLFLNLGYWF